MLHRIKIWKLLVWAVAGAVGLVLLGSLILVVAGVRDHMGKADVALVLGSKVEVDGTPSPRLRARLEKTLELYRAGYFPWVIASGGVGKEGFDEALVMRGYLVRGGIPTDHILVDSDAATTFASARNTLLLARGHKFTRVLVVSQYFHLPRARLALGRFGIPVVYSARASLFEARDFYSVPREVFGYLSYWFRRYDAAEEKRS